MTLPTLSENPSVREVSDAMILVTLEIVAARKRCDWAAEVALLGLREELRCIRSMQARSASMIADDLVRVSRGDERRTA